MQKFKERLKTRRNRLGWTQEALAQKAGVSERVIAGIEAGEVEQGKTSIMLSKVEDLAKALGVSPLWLLGADEMDMSEVAATEESRPDYTAEALEILNKAAALIDEARDKIRPRKIGHAKSRASSSAPSDATALARRAEEKHDREHRKS